MKIEMLLCTLFARTVAFAPNTFAPNNLIATSTATAPPTQLQAEMGGYETKNAAVGVLSNFMQVEEKSNPIDSIDFDAIKFNKVPLETLATILDYELYNKGWFVTGNVNPIYFSEEFEFQDPDVQLLGIENYARGVYKLFDQDTSRAEIISSKVNEEKENTVREGEHWTRRGAIN